MHGAGYKARSMPHFSFFPKFIRVATDKYNTSACDTL